MLTANRVQHLLDSLTYHPWNSRRQPSSRPQSALHHPRAWSSQDGLILEWDLPGRQTNQIEVSVEKNLISIQAAAQTSDCSADLRPHIKERTLDAASAKFQLPFPVQPDNMDVVYQNGVLRLTLHKPAEEKPRKLEIRKGD